MFNNFIEKFDAHVPGFDSIIVLVRKPYEPGNKKTFINMAKKRKTANDVINSLIRFEKKKYIQTGQNKKIPIACDKVANKNGKGEVIFSINENSGTELDIREDGITKPTRRKSDAAARINTLFCFSSDSDERFKLTFMFTDDKIFLNSGRKYKTEKAKMMTIRFKINPR